jgi:hypothetical protein
MEQPIIVGYRWTVDEFIAANSLVNQRSMLIRPFFRILLVMIILFAILSMGFILYQKNWGLLAIFAIVGLAVVIRKPLNRWGWRRQFTKHPNQNFELEMQFTSSIIYSSSKLGKSETIWDAIIEVVEAKNGFLMFTTPQICLWLPIHGFQNENDIITFRTLAQSKVTKYRLMK